MFEHIVDYFSFSVTVPKLMTQWHLSEDGTIPFFTDERTNALCWLIASQTDWHEAGKFGCFDKGIRFPEIGLTYYEGEKSNVSLIQLSGSGCEHFREKDLLSTIIGDWRDRCTRIDIALDYETDVEPQDFIQRASNNRFKISQHIERESGATWYRGSRESSRFARVYRYRSPHPRSGFLRCEYQLRDKEAKSTAESVYATGVDATGRRLHATFGWTHSIALDIPETPKLRSVPRPETKGNTVFWLYKQVLPALRKSAEKGDLETLIAFESSLRAIIDEYQVIREDKQNGMAYANGINLTT